MQPVTKLIRPVTLEQMRQGILHIQEVLHSEGMTAVKDPDRITNWFATFCVPVAVGWVWSPQKSKKSWGSP